MKKLMVGLLVFAVAMIAPVAAQAVDIKVTTTADEFGEGPNNCSLREAITSAQSDASLGGCPAGSGADTILLPGGTYLITRAGAGEDSGSTGDLDISGPNNLEIRAESPTDRVIVDGNQLDRVFDKQGTGETRMNSIRVRGGLVSAIEDGGGIRVSGGGLFAENVTVDGNETAYQGGGIAVYSALHLTNSTVSGNRAGGSGGGLYVPGGALVQARSTTIVNNQADVDGTGNGVGGGFSEVASTSVGFTNVLNAGNTSAPPVGEARSNDCNSGPNYYPRFTLQSQLFGPADCLIAFDPGTNRVSMEPQVGPLGYHGGQTPTHNLLRGAIAIGNGGTAAPDTCPPIDQNGKGRQVGSCDIGSTTYIPKPIVRIANVLPKKKVVRGKKARTFTVVVRNSGDAIAEKLNVCLRLPKASRKALKFRGKPCRKAGDLAAGKAKRVKIRLAKKPRAKKRAFVVRATAKPRGLKQVTRNFKVRVR